MKNNDRLKYYLCFGKMNGHIKYGNNLNPVTTDKRNNISLYKVSLGRALHRCKICRTRIDDLTSTQYYC